jgi:hypothetical protein
MKYFFMWFVFLVAGTAGIALGRVARAGRLCWLAICRLVIFEISGIPAATTQLKIGRRNLFAKGLLLAFRASLNRRSRYLAHQLLLVTTRCTLEIIDRHLLTQPEELLAENFLL